MGKTKKNDKTVQITIDLRVMEQGVRVGAEQSQPCGVALVRVALARAVAEIFHRPAQILAQKQAHTEARSGGPRRQSEAAR